MPPCVNFAANGYCCYCSSSVISPLLEQTNSVLSAMLSEEDKSESDMTSKSLLSDKAILRYMQTGKVVVYPFNRQNLSTSSFDVTLGRFFYRESAPEPGKGIYNPYCKKMVEKVWGANNLQEARRAGDWMAENDIHLENIREDDEIIWISPGETILGHTNEFIGGRGSVTTMMKARSSMGRNFIEVCKCAGWGDIGYVNRWTMEITNNSRYYSIPLVVGRRIAQIIFFDSEGTIDDRDYSDSGKYQCETQIEELVANWKPQDMLPKMYLDRELFKSDK